jgi:tetratricopeptide (TPR) repeat protein
MSEEDKRTGFDYSGLSYGARLRFGVASFLRRSERMVDGMVAGYERMCTLGEEDAEEIYRTMGDDLARQGLREDAVTALENALAIRPTNTAARFQLALLYRERGDKPRAMAELERALAEGIDTFELHSHLGDCKAELEQWEAAVTHYQRALERQPDSAETAYRLGAALDELKRYEEAIAAFERARTLAPHDPLYQQSLGFALEGVGRRPEAIECFKRALVLERRASK